MTIRYEDHNGSQETYRCRRSGRSQFDMTEGNHKCRWLVSQGHARWAKLMDQETLVTHWEWNIAAREPQKLFGPDL